MRRVAFVFRFGRGQVAGTVQADAVPAGDRDLGRVPGVAARRCTPKRHLTADQRNLTNKHCHLNQHARESPSQRVFVCAGVLVC